jgi:hypothetical protein
MNNGLCTVNLMSGDSQETMKEAFHGFIESAND